MSAILGKNCQVLCAAVNDAMIEALKSSGCKVLLSSPDGEHREIMLPSGDFGLELKGTRCYMNLEATVPKLRSLLTPPELSKEAIDRVNVYLSPAGTGAPLHFDSRTVLIVQLVGTKLWKVSKAPAIPSPHRNCVAPKDSTWVDYDGKMLVIPQDYLYALLHPGDWLLVPKGNWHETFTVKGSISATLAEP